MIAQRNISRKLEWSCKGAYFNRLASINGGNGQQIAIDVIGVFKPREHE